MTSGEALGSPPGGLPDVEVGSQKFELRHKTRM
jgi:hypothetical protein